MKKIILLLALALPVALSAQDTIIRSFAATCTFQNFVLTPSGRYSGTLLVNDQTNTYRGDSVKVNDLVYAPSATLYVIDTVSSKNRFTATVIIRRISGKNAAPTGVGDVFRPTPNYKFYGFTPDNQNGLPSQAQFIKLTGIINRLDSLIYAVASASGGVMDGDKGDIIISSGGGVYTIDSLAVTKGKIAAAAVDSTKIGTSAIATSNISNGAVTNAKVGVGVVTTNPVSSGIGFLPMYAATLDGNDSLTNSIVRQSSSKIGIGITPDSTFTVDGSGRFVSPVAASKFIPTGNVPTGNGMYLPQANNVAFSANGVERLRLSNEITANGLFNVVDSIVPIISLDRSNLPNNQRIKFLTSNSDYSLSAGQVNGSGNYQSQMTIDSSGNVGIGTPFPATRLHVQGQLTVSDLTKSGNSRGIVAYQSDGTIDTLVIGGAIELVNDTLTVKASGIDSNMLASSSVTWVKLAQAVKDSITAGGGGGGLGELHDVNVSGAVNGNLLRYNSSLSIWEDAQADSASIATSAIKTVHIADSAVTSIKLASASVGLNTATTSGTLPVSKGGTGLTTFGGAGRVPYSTGATGTGLQFDTLFRVFPANSNFFFGQNTGAAITTGLFNNFIGGDAGRETTIGNFNNFLGSSAGEKNTTGSANQFIGNATGANNTTGNSNIFIGNSTGNENRTGSFNYFIGNSAGRNNRNGDMNIFIGRQAGYNTVDTLSGSNNIGIGALAGDNIKFGASKNIAIGDSIDYPIADGNKQLTIGNLIFGVNIDSTGTAIPVNGKVGILNNNPSTALDVSGAITATAFQPLILRRNLSANTSQLQQLFQLKNASDAYVNYGAIASEIVSNTAGKQIGNMRFSVIDSSDNGTLVNRLILGGNGLSAIGKNLNTNAARTLDVFGEMRIRDLITDTPTRIVGADADGDLGQLVIGTGLSLVGDTLTSTGGSGVADGDKGDITVSNNGDTWSIDAGAVVWDDLAQAVKDSIGAGGGGGGVTSITAGTGLTGGTITTSGTIAADTNFLITVYDTAAMLSPYLREVDTLTLSNRINLKLNISDTTAMLAPYLREADTLTLSNRINLKLNISDTTAMLAPYLREADTLTLSNRINLKQNILIAGTGIGISNDTISWTGSGGVADGDKGDIDVTSSGTVWTIDTAAVTKLKLANNSVGANQLDTTAVTAGSYVNPRITVDQDGRLTAAVSDTMAMIIACSDEKTDLDTATAAVTFRAPFAFTVLGVRANVNTAPVGAAIQVDINETGVSILSTKITIDASEKTSLEAGTAPVISDSTIANDAEVTIDIDQVGTTTKGKGLKVTILYRKN